MALNRMMQIQMRMLHAASRRRKTAKQRQQQSRNSCVMKNKLLLQGGALPLGEGTGVV